jgi:hypothetical protein
MVYLIHFDEKLKHAKHYIGYCSKTGLLRRIIRHRKGHGAKILAELVKRNIGFRVARVWNDGDRTFERLLKNRKKSQDLCPICNKNCKKSKFKRSKNTIFYF